MPCSGPDEPGRPKCGVEPVGFRERVRIEGDDGIDVGALLVVGVDPVEVALHELARGQPAGSDRRVDVVDGRLDDLERRCGLGLRGACAKHRDRHAIALAIA